MWKIKRLVTVCSTHYLNKYDGACKFMHGHNWNITVYCKGNELDECGMLLDFKEIKKSVNQLDHKVLNEVEFLKNINPTAENIAKAICEEIPYCYAVTVEETKGCEVTYEQE